MEGYLIWCNWLRLRGYRFPDPICDETPAVLDANHALNGLIVSELENEVQNDREGREYREATYKQLASDKALKNFIWTLTVSLLVFAATSLARSYIATRRGS